METNKIVVTVKNLKKGIEEDIEIPLFITANDLVIALNSIYDLRMDIDNIADCFIKTENPITLLKGNRTLGEFGLHHGTVLIVND